MRLKWDFTEWLDFANRIVSVTEFEDGISKAAQSISKSLHKLLIKNTPVDFGTLQAFWQTEENYSYMVERKANGYTVTLINRAIYALWVNDGHKQRPGRFIPGYWEGNHFRYDPNANGGMRLKKPWVKGKFFVEKSILELENSTQLNAVIYKQLQTWFRWCVNG